MRTYSCALCQFQARVLSGAFGRSFVTCYGAVDRLMPKDLEKLTESMKMAKGPVHVHLAGIYSYGPALRRALPALLGEWRRLADGLGLRLTISVDVNGHEADQVAGVKELLPAIDLFKGNVKEVEAVLGDCVDGAMARMAEGGISSVITNGAEGARWCSLRGRGVVRPPALPAEWCCDPTGAGDASAAALLASWCADERLEEAARQGCIAGALNCTHLGGCDTPVTYEEMKKFAATEKRLRWVGEVGEVGEEGDSGKGLLNEAELFQAIHFASYPRRITDVQIVVYANKEHKNLELLRQHAPFPVKILRQEGDWKGTLDKLIGYWTYLKTVNDDDLIVLLDAFDVFPNGFDGHVGGLSEMALCGTLAGWTDPDIEVLVALGWTATKLATLRGCRGGILDGILAAAKKRREAFEATAADLRELMKQCDHRSANIHRGDAGRGSQELLEAHLADQRAKRRRTFEGMEEKEVIEKIKMVGSAKVTKWPTRLGKKLHMAGSDLALRELAEKTERDRWLSELRDIMKRAKLPVVARSSEEALLLRIAKGRRPNALRKHVKTWHKVEQWLESTYNWSWPTSPTDFAEYIEAIVQEPCARSAPEAAYKTLMFLERPN
eukprot:g22069.t1